MLLLRRMCDYFKRGSILDMSSSVVKLGFKWSCFRFMNLLHIFGPSCSIWLGDMNLVYTFIVVLIYRSLNIISSCNIRFSHRQVLFTHAFFSVYRSYHHTIKYLLRLQNTNVRRKKWQWYWIWMILISNVILDQAYYS